MAYICDAGELEPGDIVRIEKPLGPSGKPTYPHRFVALAVPTPLSVGAIIPCVGISSRTPAEAIDPAIHLPLRWMSRPGGHPSTGLTQPSIAKVTFQHVLTVHAGTTFPLVVEAEHLGNYLQSDQFHALVALVNAFNRG